jgi:hypothetical protein
MLEVDIILIPIAAKMSQTAALVRGRLGRRMVLVAVAQAF